MQTKAFFEDQLESVPLIRSLKLEYPRIREEILNFISRYNPLRAYPKYKIRDYGTGNMLDLYDHDWKAFPLSDFRNEAEMIKTADMGGFHSFDAAVSACRSQCPVTIGCFRELESQDLLANSFVSRLTPGTTIHPHRGWTPYWMRIHMGLVTDPLCWIEINGEKRTWTEGGIIAFMDGGEWPHAVYHRGAGPRIILSMDVHLNYLMPWLTGAA
jgi:aspartyl/asparaginyl beta-hydroxylase (cupin superfamily)